MGRLHVHLSSSLLLGLLSPMGADQVTLRSQTLVVTSCWIRHLLLAAYVWQCVECHAKLNTSSHPRSDKQGQHHPAP
jgi:hypothetical protein